MTQLLGTAVETGGMKDRRHWFAVIVLAPCVSAACSDRARLQPKHDISVARVGALVVEARDALTTDRPFDLRRPFERPEIYPHAGALYLEACRAGDLQSCWLAMELREPAARVLVEANCMAGDQLSCRALSDEEIMVDVRNEQEVRAGCARDQASSCVALMGDETMDYSDREQAHWRGRQLARDGCARGLLNECSVWTRDSDALVRDGWHCDLDLTHCHQLGVDYLTAGDRLNARGAYERACQYAEEPEVECAKLAKAYLDAKLDEPEPGRGRKLLDWACSRLFDAHPTEFAYFVECKGWDIDATLSGNIVAAIDDAHGVLADKDLASQRLHEHVEAVVHLLEQLAEGTKSVRAHNNELATLQSALAMIDDKSIAIAKQRLGRLMARVR